MYLVFDVGGTFIKYAVMNRDGDILEKDKTPTPCRNGETVEDFIACIGGIYDVFKDKYELEGIAMDLPGQIDVKKGIVYGGGALIYMDKVTLSPLLSARCGNLPVALENDAKAAALAEVWKGNAKSVKDAVVMVFGTGVGGAIIKNKRIHHGKHLCAGEFSFISSGMTRKDMEFLLSFQDFDGPIEEYFAHYAPPIMSVKASVMGLRHTVANAKGMKYDDVDGEMIYQMAADGDTEVQEILEDMYFSISQLCCNMQVIFDPQVILIGGGISANPLFLPGIQKYIDVIGSRFEIFSNIKLMHCKFLNDSNLYGALYNFEQLYQLL